MKNHDFVCTIWNFAVLISFSFVNKLYICECRDIPVYEDKKFIKNLLKLWKYAKKYAIIYWYCIVSSHDGGIITRRKFNMKTKVNTKSLVILGLMTALTMIFSFTPIGSIPIGPLVITLNVIPIAIAAVTVGPVGSAVIGGVFGLLSFCSASE